MKRLQINSGIVFSMIFAIVWLVVNLAWTSVALLHPEQINAKDDAGIWITRTRAQIKINGYISLGIGVAMSCLGVYMITYFLKGYIFHVRDEKFSCALDQVGLDDGFSIGPFIGLQDKGLTFDLHLKPAWEQPMRSFQLHREYPNAPFFAASSYRATSCYVQLLGRTNDEDVLIREVTFKPDDPERKQETFTVDQKFEEYFVKIKLVPPKTMKHIDAQQATLHLILHMNVALRYQDLKQWNSNSECSVSSAQMKKLN